VIGSFNLRVRIVYAHLVLERRATIFGINARIFGSVGGKLGRVKYLPSRRGGKGISAFNLAIGLESV
jgi:hypothetical protein